MMFWARSFVIMSLFHLLCCSELDITDHPVETSENIANGQEYEIENDKEPVSDNSATLEMLAPSTTKNSFNQYLSYDTLKKLGFGLGSVVAGFFLEDLFRLISKEAILLTSDDNQSSSTSSNESLESGLMYGSIAVVIIFIIVVGLCCFCNSRSNGSATIVPEEREGTKDEKPKSNIGRTGSTVTPSANTTSNTGGTTPSSTPSTLGTK